MGLIYHLSRFFQPGDAIPVLKMNRIPFVREKSDLSFPLKNVLCLIFRRFRTSMNCNPNAPTTVEFFAKVQNKLHYAVHGHTAAELIAERADAQKEHMGLTSWENAPDGKIVKTDSRWEFIVFFDLHDHFVTGKSGRIVFFSKIRLDFFKSNGIKFIFQTISWIHAA